MGKREGGERRGKGRGGEGGGRCRLHQEAAGGTSDIKILIVLRVAVTFPTRQMKSVRSGCGRGRGSTIRGEGGAIRGERIPTNGAFQGFGQ